ncbi:hypothetical protein Golob_020362, partial [Gossypium lobatum]|nr:hypothetical protein [Gossypium lobatum]
NVGSLNIDDDEEVPVRFAEEDEYVIEDYSWRLIRAQGRLLPGSINNGRIGYGVRVGWFAKGAIKESDANDKPMATRGTKRGGQSRGKNKLQTT